LGQLLLVKKDIQAFWTAQAPYLDKAAEVAPVGSPAFYQAVDGQRYRNETYLPAYLERLAGGGGRILEVGFGMGSDLRCLARKGLRAVGADLSPESARIVQRGFNVLKLTGQATAADGESLPFRSESFDAVYSFGALHHTPDTRRAVGELHRVLKSKGRCLVMLYHQGLAYRLIALKYSLLRLRGRGGDWEQFVSRAYDQTPLSKLYSRKDLQCIFSGFRDVRITIENYGGIKENKLLFWVYYLLKTVPFLMRRFGSFAMIECVK
jgi:ubiquinone/menaquinone biosynthesis C-methylase UbiE